jgi:hypothetical protein
MNIQYIVNNRRDFKSRSQSFNRISIKAKQKSELLLHATLRGRLHVRFCVRINIRFCVRFAAKGVQQVFFVLFF